MELTLKQRKGFLRTFIDTIRSTEDFEIIISADVLDRTILLCMYIEEETGKSFGLTEFVLLLYQDFIYYCVKNPLHKRILSEISTKPLKEPQEEYIKIVCDGVTTYERPSNNTRMNKKKIVSIRLDKREVQKGRIILNEMYFSEGVDISIEELLSSLWTNFIIDYREGNNKRAYKSIVKILKQLDLN